MQMKKFAKKFRVWVMGRRERERARSCTTHNLWMWFYQFEDDTIFIINYMLLLLYILAFRIPFHPKFIFECVICVSIHLVLLSSSSLLSCDSVGYRLPCESLINFTDDNVLQSTHIVACIATNWQRIISVFCFSFGKGVKVKSVCEIGLCVSPRFAYIYLGKCINGFSSFYHMSECVCRWNITWVTHADTVHRKHRVESSVIEPFSKFRVCKNACHRNGKAYLPSVILRSVLKRDILFSLLPNSAAKK